MSDLLIFYCETWLDLRTPVDLSINFLPMGVTWNEMSGLCSILIRSSWVDRCCLNAEIIYRGVLLCDMFITLGSFILEARDETRFLLRGSSFICDL